MRGLDTESRKVEADAPRILRRVTPRAIKLLHEGRRTAADPDFHLRCLERTLTALTKANYRCILPRSDQLRPRAGER